MENFAPIANALEIRTAPSRFLKPQRVEVTGEEGFRVKHLLSKASGIPHARLTRFAVWRVATPTAVAKFVRTSRDVLTLDAWEHTERLDARNAVRSLHRRGFVVVDGGSAALSCGALDLSASDGALELVLFRVAVGRSPWRAPQEEEEEVRPLVLPEGYDSVVSGTASATRRTYRVRCGEQVLPCYLVRCVLAPAAAAADSGVVDSTPHSDPELSAMRAELAARLSALEAEKLELAFYLEQIDAHERSLDVARATLTPVDYTRARAVHELVSAELRDQAHFWRRSAETSPTPLQPRTLAVEATAEATAPQTTEQTARPLPPAPRLTRVPFAVLPQPPVGPPPPRAVQPVLPTAPPPAFVAATSTATPSSAWIAEDYDDDESSTSSEGEFESESAGESGFARRKDAVAAAEAEEEDEEDAHFLALEARARAEAAAVHRAKTTALPLRGARSMKARLSSPAGPPLPPGPPPPARLSTRSSPAPGPMRRRGLPQQLQLSVEAASPPPSVPRELLMPRSPLPLLQALRANEALRGAHPEHTLEQICDTARQTQGACYREQFADSALLLGEEGTLNARLLWGSLPSAWRGGSRPVKAFDAPCMDALSLSALVAAAKGRGESVLIAKSSRGYVFGAYVNADWGSGTTRPQKANLLKKGAKRTKRRFGGSECFLYSMTHRLRVPYHGRLLAANAGASFAMMSSMDVSVSIVATTLQKQPRCSGASSSTTTSISFGLGDLVLTEDLVGCSSALEASFGIGISPSSIEAKELLAGAVNFNVDALELWTLE